MAAKTSKDGTGFSAAVDYWVRKARRRTDTVFRESFARIAEIANTPIGEGGKMPVDTGFLRASLVAVINGGPPEDTKKPAGSTTYTYDGTEVGLALLDWKPGDRIAIFWTANYARYMEYRYGFQRSAAQMWPVVVRQVTREVQSIR